MIYADNAATTRLSDQAFERMLPFLREWYGNASSLHSLGTKSRRAVEQARGEVARVIGAEVSEIVFTSGGSEANSWLLRSMAAAFRNEPMHIITTSIEHHSVLNACRACERDGAEVTYLPVDEAGRVLPKDVEAAIRPDTKLATIMLANNEIGTIQPVAEIGRLLRDRGILFHTDAVQAAGRIPVDVRGLCVDFLTASAHKFNGAKGTGFLFKRSGLSLGLSPLIFGGKQEMGLRGGTENVAGIVAAGCAITESAAILGETAERLGAMADATIRGILTGVPGTRALGDIGNRLPGLVNLVFKGVSGESLMHLLDIKGICVSTSSACASGEVSHVLLALGLTEDEAKSSIRISYGRYNSMEDADTVVSAVCDACKKIRGSR